MLASIFAVVADANRYFASQEPWALRKRDPARMNMVLYVTAETLRRVAILLQPVMPASAAKLLDILGVDKEERSFGALTVDTSLTSGQAMPTPEPVFPRYVEPDAG